MLRSLYGVRGTELDKRERAVAKDSGGFGMLGKG